MRGNGRANILILSGEFGEGHKQAAQALLESSSVHAAEAEVHVVDFMALVSPRLHTVSKNVFMQGMRTFPQLYGYFFQMTRRPNPLSTLLKKCTMFGAGRLLQLLHEWQPTVVVSTFPMAAAAMSWLKASGATDVSTVTVMTDHTDHSYWVHRNTDHYIVGSQRVRRALQQLGIADKRISVTGIPIRENFCRGYNREALREKHQLSTTMPTVLLMGGGHGMLDSSVVDLLLSDALPEPMQFIIVCGHRAQLKAQLEQRLSRAKHAKHPNGEARSKHRFIILGYVDYVHELMALSDFIITKPGGLTTSEAIALELPMLLYRPLPGQEQDNATFLVDAGVALEAKTADELQELLVKMATMPNLLQAMRELARQFPMREATHRAWEAIVRCGSHGLRSSHGSSRSHASHSSHGSSGSHRSRDSHDPHRSLDEAAVSMI